MFIKKKLSNHLYNFFLILIVILFEFSTNIVSAKNFNISDIEIEQVYDLKFQKSKVIDLAFKEAFKTLIFKILESKDRNILSRVSINEIKGLVDNFTITNEQFVNDKYQSKFNVEFDKKKIINYLNSKGAITSSINNLETLMLPIFVDRDLSQIQYYNQNKFYLNWNINNEKYYQIKYILPAEDLEDLSLINQRRNNLEDYDFKEIIDKYNLKNSIILIIFKSKNNLKAFSKINFGENKMLNNKSYDLKDSSDLSELLYLINSIKDDYEDKWKSLNKINSSIILPVRLSVDSNNFELSNKFEEFVINLDLASEFSIEKFDNNEIIYKIIFNSSPDKFLNIMLNSNFNIDTSNEIWKIK